MKKKLATIDRARRLARDVEVEYLSGNDEGDDLRLEDAILNVANSYELSFQTVKDAHDKHSSRIRTRLTEIGVLKEVKTSKGWLSF